MNSINQRLKALVNECEEETLREAMAYSLLAGGKRLRPRLLLAAYGGVSSAHDETAMDFACAVEMIHTYSLIHDDLPAMDDDDLRRGKPANHIVYGEALAILAGDALLSSAMEIMARICAGSRSLRPAKAMGAITRAAGANGMIAGQVLDIAFENKKIGIEALLSVQERKTMALIASCLEAGAILGGGTAGVINKMKRLGRCIGLAFQIKDDILDVTATASALGKPVNSDDRNKKNTYVTVLGMEQAAADYTALSAEAIAILKTMRLKDDSLRILVNDMIKREK
jgi:geranylgeranyl diphosphate synthase type II